MRKKPIRKLIEKIRGKDMAESPVYDVVKEQIAALIKEVKDDIGDNVLTLTEVWVLSQHTVTAFVKIADTLSASGEDKKAVVMLAAEKFFDDVIGPIDIPQIPNFIEPTFDKISKEIFLSLVSAGIEYIVKFKNKGN